jgi:glycosyltransferase involved in cell wall biosynthesis
MKTILASVYAVNPYKGSEDGTGWNLVLQIARFNKVIAVTRENNRPHIERFFRENSVPGGEHIRFEYFDLPYWMRFWKRGGKNALLYYYFWQMALPGFIRKKRLVFDITHNLNFHSDWTPSFLWRLGKPFVWGPVGHHPRIPRPFIGPVYGRKRWLQDQVRWLAKTIFWHLDPFLRRTKKKALRVIAINTAVNTQLKVDPAKLVLMPAVATEDMQGGRSAHAGFQVISVGRFVALKGFDVTIRAFAAFLGRLKPDDRSQVKLVLVGNGPELGFLRSLCRSEEMGRHVEIIPWIERAALREKYSESTLFFFPSHEGAGMVVPEALCCGLPVLCFDNAGPGEFITEECGIKIRYRTYTLAIEDFADALERLYRNPATLERLRAGARKQFLDKFQWDQKGEILKQIYDEIA